MGCLGPLQLQHPDLSGDQWDPEMSDRCGHPLAATGVKNDLSGSFLSRAAVWVFEEACSGQWKVSHKIPRQACMRGVLPKPCA